MRKRTIWYAIMIMTLLITTSILYSCGGGDSTGYNPEPNPTDPSSGITSTPQPNPTGVESPDPFPVPSTTPDPTPTDSPTSSPTPTQSPTSSPTPTQSPTSSPTPSPTPTQSPTPSPTPTQSPTGPAWLQYLNMIRAQANLPPVTDKWEYVDGNIKHSLYMVKNNVIMHDQNPNNPYYTPEGREAAKNSNIMVTSAATLSHQEALDAWITGPFHGLGMIDPKLCVSGYGSYSEKKSGYQSGAGVDVLRGRCSIPPTVNFPIMWPAHGKTVHLTRYPGNEYPDPLTGTGFKAPSGIPIYLQLGAGNITPSVTASSFSRGGINLPHAVYHQNTYVNPDSNAQSLGRSILRSRSAIVMMPKDPLLPGNTYEVSITSNGVKYTWSFNVSTTARDAHRQPGDYILK